jgi:hypothetical protein
VRLAEPPAGEHWSDPARRLWHEDEHNKRKVVGEGSGNATRPEQARAAPHKTAIIGVPRAAAARRQYAAKRVPASGDQGPGREYDMLMQDMPGEVLATAGL